MFLKNLFKARKLKKDIDLSVLVADIHSHLVHAFDDGSKNMEMSISLIKQLKDLGYKKLITTPHLMNNYSKEDISVMESRFEELKLELRKQNIEIELELGAEHLLDEETSQRIKDNKIKSFGNDYILVEFPITVEPMGIDSWLFDLEVAGYNIILAHVERFLYLGRDKEKLIELKNRGILFQLNIMSLSGYYGKEVMQFAKYLIKESLIDLVGSDCHGQRHIDAIKKTLREPLLKQLIDSGKLLNNKL